MDGGRRVEGLEAGTVAGLVLRAVDLHRFGVGERVRPEATVDHERDAGEHGLGKGDRGGGDHPVQRLAERLVTREVVVERRHGARVGVIDLAPLAAVHGASRHVGPSMLKVT
jgi:hypothetical protein